MFSIFPLELTQKPLISLITNVIHISRTLVRAGKQWNVISITSYLFSHEMLGSEARL